MASYSDEELIDAVRSEIKTNKKFKKDLNKAVESKDSSWLSNLVSWVAEKIFGKVVEWVIDTVAGAFR